MVVVPLSKQADDAATTPGLAESETMNWVGFAAGGTLVTAGLLLLAGTALALLDQKQTLHSWWNALPGYIDQVQQVLNQVQSTVEDVAAKREALRRALAR